MKQRTRHATIREPSGSEAGSVTVDATPTAVEMKVCSRCGTKRPVSMFFVRREKGRPDRYTSACRLCHADASNRYRSAKARERIALLPPPQDPKWTAAETDTLLKGYGSKSLPEIATEVGRSKAAVRNRRYRLRSKPKNVLWTDRDARNLVAYYKAREGLPLCLGEYANATGRTKPFLARKAKDLGLSDPRHSWHPSHRSSLSTKSGKRPDLEGRFFRSSWEANYARYLNFLKASGEIAGWEFEPKTFVFTGVTRGELTYTPDFRVTLPNGKSEWHEVKGWMTPKSKAKLRRMEQFYPDEKVTLIQKPEYQAIARSCSKMLAGWE